jgi:DNA gyrase/topoisomerase IV subunit A
VKKNGDAVCLKRIGPKDEVILVTDTGRTIRFNAETIPGHKRGGMGVKLQDLKEDEKISGVAIIGDIGEE